ncbi:phage protein [Sporosarcina contaminans]|uniref:Phage protein n=1 Tax=Sporosarcina contaminans TaxID=633403 RepID=A0ABW3U0J6_9BACL
MDLFIRKIRLEAGGKLLEPPLTIYFDSEFDDSEKINTTKIKVYNLSSKTIAGIKQNSPVLLSAGYGNDFGVIFEGVVKNPQTTWNGVDKITEIEGVDRHGLYLTKKVNKTFSPGTTSSTILRFLIQEAGLGIGDFSPVQDFVYRKGKTLKGNVSSLIKAVVKDTKSKMHINRGKIYIRDVKKGDNTGFVINKDTGLIDVPERIESEVTNKKTKKKSTRVGWKVKMLLNHKITVDSIIVLQSKVVTGTFRVVKGRHYCEGNSFYTEVEVY